MPEGRGHRALAAFDSEARVVLPGTAAEVLPRILADADADADV